MKTENTGNPEVWHTTRYKKLEAKSEQVIEGLRMQNERLKKQYEKMKAIHSVKDGWVTYAMGCAWGKCSCGGEIAFGVVKENTVHPGFGCIKCGKECKIVNFEHGSGVFQTVQKADSSALLKLVEPCLPPPDRSEVPDASTPWKISTVDDFTASIDEALMAPVQVKEVPIPDVAFDPFEL